MVEAIQRKLSDSPLTRWTALIIVSLTMMFGYFITDVMDPLEDLLTTNGEVVYYSNGSFDKIENTTKVTVNLHKTVETELQGTGWSSTEYGRFSGAYGWFNVFLFMLLIGGLILDRMGIRFTGVMASSLMLGGALIKFYAVSPYFTFHGLLWGMHIQVWIAGLGFAIFGVGCEITGVTVSKILAKWFTGHGLALAMGLQVGMARIGTACALGLSLPIAKHFGHLSWPVLFGCILLFVGLLFFLVFCVMDRKLDKQVAADSTLQEADEFHLKDVKLILINRGFWLISLLCLLFYSGVFPFLKFATKLMIYKYNVSPDLAGYIPALLPFGTILLTPLFGSIYDRIGKGATLMIIGSVMLVVVHIFFALPILDYWWFAIIIMIVLGISFSLVPSAMWPSVSKIIPQKQLGSAYSLIFYIQNIGLMCVPMLIGWVIDRFAKHVNAVGVVSYNYMIPMSIFAMFGVLAVFVSIVLKIENKKRGYGLEEADIKK